MSENKLKSQLNDDGYTILNDVLSCKECDKYIQIVEECYHKFSGKYFQPKVVSKHKLDDKSNELIVFNLHNKHTDFVKLLDHPKVFPIVELMLQEGSYNNAEPIIHANSAARTPLRGAAPQHLHIDSRYPGAPFALYVQVFFCLDDFTRENGATRVVPGSHKKREFPQDSKKYDEEICLCAPRGSVIIMNGGLWHGSSSNTTHERRWGIINSFARWFIKPSFDYTKNMPLEIYSQLNDTQKELLGYKCNPPKDEFTRISARSSSFEEPDDYQLPQI